MPSGPIQRCRVRSRRPGAGSILARTCRHGCVDLGIDAAAIRGGGHSSSFAQPRIASAFFLNMIKAAACASAFSFRARSRCKSLIRFLSSLVSHEIRVVDARSFVGQTVPRIVC